VQQLNPAASPEVAAVIERAVRLEPAARFETAQAMGAALRRLAGADLIGMATRDVQSTAVPRRWLVSAVAAILIGPMLMSRADLVLTPPVSGPTPFEPAQIVLIRDQPLMPAGANDPIGPPICGRIVRERGDHGPGIGGR
jgi:hypothetical protein